MSDEADMGHRGEQIARTSALLTAKLEDAAGLAVEGQGRQTEEQLRELALQIAELAGETATIAAILGALLAGTVVKPTSS